MKIYIFTLVLALFFAAAFAESQTLEGREVLVGGHMGTMASSVSGRQENTPPDFVFGAESSIYKNALGLGLNYTYVGISPSGQGTVKVGQSNHWISLQGRLRYPSPNLSPYVFVGFGPYFQTVRTEVMGVSESHSATLLSTEVGAGVLAPIDDSWRAGLSLRYYQFSNVSGFQASFGLDYVL